MVASFQTLGREILVNSYTDDRQGDPNIAANPKSGGFQIVWESQGQDGDGLGVFGQGFSSSGKQVGTEFQINTVIEGDQENVDVTFNEDGAGAWTWLTKAIWFTTVNVDDTPIAAGVADNYRTRSKTFGFEGEEFNNEERLRFGLTREGKEQEAQEIRVISLGGTQFATSTPIYEVAVGYGGVDIDQFTASDSPVRGGQWSRRTVNDDRFPLGQTPTGDIGVQSDGVIIAVSAMASDIAGNDGVIQFERFFQPPSQGLAFKVGERIVLEESSGLTGPATDPRVAILKDDAIAITWAEWNLTGKEPQWDVHVQVMNADGTPRSSSVLVHKASGADQTEPEITALKDGGFMVAWTDAATSADTSGSAVMVQRFNADAVKLGQAIVANDTTGGDQNAPALTTLKNGNVVVTWESASGDGDGAGVMAQIFKLAGYGQTKAQYLGGTDADEKFSTGGRDDTVDGGSGNDTLLGGGGGDRLNGEAGNDVIAGSTGNDRASGGAGNDKLDGGGGKDTLAGDAGSDRLFGKGGADKLDGGADNDKLDGGADGDRLNGGDGNDTLLGGAGNDVLDGGKGNDQMRGQTGEDRFVFRAGRDVVADFQDNVDTVVFAHSLVKGKLSIQKLAGIVDEKADALVFQFGANKLTIEGVSDFSDLRNDIAFI